MQRCNSVTEDCLKSTCRCIVENISEQNIKLVILIGSFSKGEGSVYIDKNNRPVFLSDMELIIVLRQTVHYARLKNKIAQLNANVTKDLKEEGFDVELDLGFTLESALRKMPATAFTYELKNYGKIIWGNPEVLDLIPDYRKDEIKKEESVVVIFNRAIEQLKEVFGDKKNDMKKQTYQICKGYVNLTSSILIAEGKYEPLYRDMSAKLEQIDYILKQSLRDVTGQADLVEKIKKWMDLKLNPKEEGLLNSREEVLAEWEKLRDYYKDIWLWESNKFKVIGNRSKVTGGLELAKLYFKKEKLKDKIKGWIKLILYQEKSSIFSLLRVLRLFLKGSPKMLSWVCGMGVYLEYPLQRPQTIVHSRQTKEDIKKFIAKYAPVIPKEFRNNKLDWEDLRKIVIYNWEKFAKK